jgi:hypothetical protein
MISRYPTFTPLSFSDRPFLDPLFRVLPDGISELTFAGMYCFAAPYDYHLAQMDDDTLVFSGKDKGGERFFLSPFRLPSPGFLNELLNRFPSMKLASEAQAESLAQMGYTVSEDRDNFDYLYNRTDLAQLAGRALQKKRNLVHRFTREHSYRAVPLTTAEVADALFVLDTWRAYYNDQADYQSSRLALENLEELNLHGRVVYADEKPAGYSLGETYALGRMFVVHYEKALPEMKGLSQFVNMEFAQSLPSTIQWINREQDVGELGLRQAKLTYRPSGFVKKFRVRKKPTEG